MHRNEYSNYSPNHMMAQHHPRSMYKMDSSHGDFTQMMHGSHPASNHHHHSSHHSSHHTAHGGHSGHHSLGHHGGEYDHEPLALNNGPSSHHGFYQQMNAPMLHVSTDFGNVGGVPPMHHDDDLDDDKSTNGQKRSREELNQKEKKRMFKLNETINMLKKLLDDAGVSCKKNKQSILDNTAHYISMLRNDLVIAKQKADHAERILHSSGGGGGQIDATYENYFEQSSMPTLIMSLDMQMIRANRSFRETTGYGEDALKKKETLLSCLTTDPHRVRNLVQSVVESRKTGRTVVQTTRTNGRAQRCSLTITVVTDHSGKPDSLECVLLPIDDRNQYGEMLKEDVTLDDVSSLV
jgi:PAS domain S-box-containing protein